MNKKLHMEIFSYIPLENIAFSLSSQLSEKEIVKFVKILDEECQDWEVTKNLYTYFNKQMKILYKQEKGLNNNQENN